MTPAAREALRKSAAVVGYKRYIDLISPLIAGKEVLASGMTEEVDRVKKALDLARAGRVVSVVSSGDPGVYGMAGLVLELNKDDGVDVEIVPGITSVNAAASLLGAPLMNDFAVISLSDLLTPWEVIEKRICSAAEGDFVIAIYNPRSKKRIEQLVKAHEIVKRYRPCETPVGIVTNAFREGQSVTVTDLAGLPDEEINMLSIVIIGNSQTIRNKDRLITSRGYQTKYSASF